MKLEQRFTLGVNSSLQMLKKYLYTRIHAQAKTKIASLQHCFYTLWNRVILNSSHLSYIPRAKPHIHGDRLYALCNRSRKKVCPSIHCESLDKHFQKGWQKNSLTIYVSSTITISLTCTS